MGLKKLGITLFPFILPEGVDLMTVAADHLAFAPGDILTAHLSYLPEEHNQSTITWMVALALAVLTSGYSLSYLLRRKSVQSVRFKDDPDRRKPRLPAEIAQLDNDFEDNKITEEHYRRLRAGKKAQLVALMQRAKEESNAK